MQNEPNIQMKQTGILTTVLFTIAEKGFHAKTKYEQ